MNSNWLDKAAVNAHQDELYRTAANQRLARIAARPSPIVYIYAKLLTTLGKRLFLRGIKLQKRTARPALSTAEMKAI
jgi:hypothetical protein